ncbi:pectinesterase [Salvia divinorum]|uniref:Pectinesterase n=1 Tax=Salvia divinorum TaxID=28513 RepID=A0ABD1GII7_SALDI
MASLVALIIFIAIAISQAVATTDDVILEIGISNESQGKNLTELTMQQISLAIPYFSDNGEIRRMINNTDAYNTLALSALKCCQELLPLAIDNLNRSLSTDVTKGGLMSMTCAAGTNMQTCVEGFEDQPQVMFESVYNKLKYPIDLNRGITKIMARSNNKSDLLKKDSDYPGWLSDGDRNLLLADSKINADVVVAKDGSGKYKRISDAVKNAPRFSKTRYVIYVKSGVYNENVNIGSDRWNVMMFGDGMEKTIISSNRSHGAGLMTYDTPTFAVRGEGFMARDIKFANTAGAINGQAVALLSDSDRSVFYRCSMDGYQDTLCANSKRQFYRECEIYGTIDLIFGSAAVVIQKSSIFVRKPVPGQDNVITAHGETDSQCQTGIVVQTSTIQASENLKGVSTFLGRPWKPYATSVFMQNNFNDLIDPRGWRPWNTTPGAKPTPDTVFLAEYENRGNSAMTTGRVKWKGVKTSLSFAEASGFTVGSFIQGKDWLPATQVPYDLGL